MLFKSELKELLKKGGNSVYVYSGCGYSLQEITTNKDSLSIEELAYICIKAGKGYIVPIKWIEETSNIESYDYIEEYENNESWVYVDLSTYGLGNAYFFIDNLRSDEVEIYS